MRTACAACGKEFAAVETALAHHIREHEPVKRAVGGVINGRFVKHWPDDAPFLYRGGQRYSDYADLTPQSTLNDDTKTGSDSDFVGPAIPQHVGTDWGHTPCLCNCHYGRPECNERACQ